MGRAARHSRPLFSGLRLFCVFLLSTVLARVSPAAEIDNGTLRLLLHETAERFSLHLIDPADGSAVPLLFPHDPRTSVLSVATGNLVRRMGESAGFSAKVQTLPDGGKLVWESPRLGVIQRFSFERREDPFPLEGILMRIELENRTDGRLPVGARLLLDTWLGEAAGVHFRTDTVARIPGERRIAGPAAPAWWLSPAGEEQRTGFTGNGEPGLYILTDGTGLTEPDAVVVANWKRLRDAVWDYRLREGTGFGAEGFSVDDSAIAVYYEPVSVEPGGIRSISLFLGVPASESPRAPGPDAGADLAAEIDSLIRQIERLLAQERADTADVEALERRLAALKERLATGAGE